MSIEIYLIAGSWVLMLLLLAVHDWRLRKVQSKIDAVWDFIARRADVVAVLDGWMELREEEKKENVPAVIVVPQAPLHGFATATATIKPESKE